MKETVSFPSCYTNAGIYILDTAGKVCFEDWNETVRNRGLCPLSSFHSVSFSGISLILFSFRYSFLPFCSPRVLFCFFLFSWVNVTWPKQGKICVSGGRDNFYLNFERSLFYTDSHCNEDADYNSTVMVPFLS